jgi:hypothetical protein
MQALFGTRNAFAVPYQPNPYTFTNSFNCPEFYSNNTTPNPAFPAQCANPNGTSGEYQGTYINLVNYGLPFETSTANLRSGTLASGHVGIRPVQNQSDSTENGSFTFESWVKSPDYGRINDVVFTGAFPRSNLTHNLYGMTFANKGLYTISGISYSVWYLDMDGYAQMWFAIPAATMTTNTWHWMVVNQDSNGIQIFADGVAGFPIGSTTSLDPPTAWASGASTAYRAAGTSANGRPLRHFAAPDGTRRDFASTYQIGAWFSPFLNDQKRDTISGASFGDVRYTSPSIYSSQAATLPIPTEIPTALPGTQLLLSSGIISNGITDTSGNMLLEFVNVTTNTAGASVSGFTSGQTQSLLTLANTSTLVGTPTTLTTTGGSGSGAISFVVNSGLCTISSGNILTASSVGTCVVAATKANDGTYNSRTATGNIVASAPSVISIANLPITAPVSGATPLSSLSSNGQYTTAITWNGSPTTFATSTVYTATATVTPVAGYTLTGVTSNFFTVTGATSVNNSANAGVITAVFPATAAQVVIPTPTPAVVTGPPPSFLKIKTPPTISLIADIYTCAAGTLIFWRYSVTEEPSKITYQKISLLKNGENVASSLTLKSQASFEKNSSWAGSTMTCQIEAAQENTIGTFSSLAADKYNELSKIKGASIKAAGTKYFADRTAAYDKRRVELSRIATEKASELKVARSSAQVKAAAEKYRLAMTRISQTWKAEIQAAPVTRDSSIAAATATFIQGLAQHGLSIIQP